MKCAKWVLVSLMGMAPALHALDVSYGKERKKYYNVRILDKDTYRFVASCQAPCMQEIAKVDVTVCEVRAAKERPDMWIADVAFNQDWQITFLVFKQGDTYRVKSPIHLIFVQQALKKRTEEAIVAAVKELK